MACGQTGEGDKQAREREREGGGRVVHKNYIKLCTCLPTPFPHLVLA